MLRNDEAVSARDGSDVKESVACGSKRTSARRAWLLSTDDNDERELSFPELERGDLALDDLAEEAGGERVGHDDGAVAGGASARGAVLMQEL